MVKVLIAGATGMLGHKLCQTFAGRFETYATIRQTSPDYTRFGIFNSVRLNRGVEANDVDSFAKTLASVKPDVIVNSIGIVKQDAAAKDPIAAISINALFPHRLAQLSRAHGARLIHISTDCVFSGRKGNYSEDDKSDADDLYGRTKDLGEVSGPGCLTLRTSMIGRELASSHGLVEWFYRHQGKRVRGFKKAIFTGFTTAALSRIIADLVENHPKLEGIYNVAANPISKFDLLTLINQKRTLNIEIEPDETFICDRSLDGARFRAAANFVPPDWSDMVTDLVNDPTPYDAIRRSLIVS
jgi:dTDP-4-dehydrorhamnose reductase